MTEICSNMNDRNFRIVTWMCALTKRLRNVSLLQISSDVMWWLPTGVCEGMICVRFDLVWFVSSYLQGYNNNNNNNNNNNKMHGKLPDIVSIFIEFDIHFGPMIYYALLQFIYIHFPCIMNNFYSKKTDRLSFKLYFILTCDQIGPVSHPNDTFWASSSRKTY